MMPSRGLRPLRASVSLPPYSIRAPSRLLSTATPRTLSRPILRSRTAQKAVSIQQRNISWSPSSWFSGTSSTPPSLASDQLRESPASSIADQVVRNDATIAQTTTSQSVPPIQDSSLTSNTASASTGPLPVESVNSDIIQEVGDSYLAATPEHIGFLHDLGLNYGYGVTSSLQWVLEHVHVYSGMPWWGSIIVTALGFRLILAPFFIKGSDMQARQNALKPLTKPISDRMMAAFKTKDNIEVQKCRSEMSVIYEKAGISLPQMFAPIAVQGVLAFCALRLLRAMAALPVPGLQDGGALWFTDLTVADPYLALPLLMAVSLHAVFRFGGDGTTMALNDNKAMRALALYIMPIAIFLSMSWFPAAVNLWLATTSTFAIGQAKLLQSPKARQYLDLAPMVKPESKVEVMSPVSAQPKTVNTLESSGARPSMQYQPPSLKYQTKIGRVDSAASSVVEQEKVSKQSILERVRSAATEKANDIGDGVSSVMEAAKQKRDEYLGEKDSSKTRSAEYMRRARKWEQDEKDRKDQIEKAAKARNEQVERARKIRKSR